MRPGLRPAGAVDLLELFQRGGQCGGQRRAVLGRLLEQCAALNPAVYRPEIRVLRGGLPDGERRGNREIELRLQIGQPAAFLLHLRLIGLAARQAHGHRIAEVERAVVVSAFFDRADRQAAPLRKLRRD